MTNITKKTLIAAGVIAALGITATTSAFAADVPAGVQLADKQEIVKTTVPKCSRWIRTRSRACRKTTSRAT